VSALLATAACVLAILVLFRLDRDRIGANSKVLWIPMAWLMIGGSRNVSEWLQMSGPVDSVDRYMEGNPVDRYVLSLLMLAGLIVLFQRRDRVIALLKANAPIVGYFVYCGISVLWSDYPLVGGKRWFRGLGDVTMVLIILTDFKWHGALRRVFTHVAFLLLPISVLFIRYYPDLGRAYGLDGSQYWTGICEGKNSLGMISLIFGMACLWTLLEIYADRGQRNRKRRLAAHGTIVIIAIYLLWISDSKTSLACFVLVGTLMTLTGMTAWARRPALLRPMMLGLVTCCVSVLFLGIGGGALETLGRNSSLTGRTDVWKLVLSFAENPLVGAGYESFWMGDRLARIVSINGGINQAHNGYIEIYLNLGLVGLTFLAAIILIGFRRVTAGFARRPEASTIRMAYFLVAVIYNFTEGAFKMMSPVWISFLLSTAAVPEIRARKSKAAIPRPPETPICEESAMTQPVA
jgi:exopolysaccharide production protein ExoQ